jgi:CHAT domain-containing protein
LVRVWEEQGEAYAAWAESRKDQTARSARLGAALACYEQGLALIDSMRTSYKAEGSKFFVGAKHFAIYEKAIGAALRLHELKADSSYDHRAFAYSERAKAGVLQQALQEARARHFAGIPDSLLERERKLRIDLAYHGTQWRQQKLERENRDSVKILAHEERLFSLNHQYEALLKKFERNYPQYFSLKYRAETVTVSDIQKTLDEKTTVVEYFAGDSALHIFAMTRNAFKIKTAPRVVFLANEVEILLSAIAGSDYGRYVQSARRLYEALIQPVAPQVEGKNLLIIPDGVLNYVPFEALLTEAVNADAAAEDFSKLPYLVREQAVSYAPSAALWLESIRRERKLPEGDLLAFAPVFPNGLTAKLRKIAALGKNFALDSTRSANGTLLATRKEVEGIEELFNRNPNFFARMFGRLFGNGSRVFIEREASERNLKAQPLSRYRYVHIATHGVANQNVPELSALMFADDSSADAEDGVLFLGEIYNLALNADLVVLSACETGIGKLSRGEGLLALSRGFIYAGAKNLLVSLWKVKDASTARLMREFYAGMLAGQTKAEALRQAKLQLIKSESANPKFAMPYYWAPFILIGQ